MKNENRAKLLIIISMVIWGTIGIFRRYIPLSSGIIAFTRGLIGTAFLVLTVVITRKKISFADIKKNLFLLCLSGALIGANWILLFESYNYTSVATATLSYYMEPIFVMLVSPIFLKEKLSLKKVLCILVALSGMVCVSGVIGMEDFKFSEIKGVLLGLGAAALYATVVIINKKMKSIGAYEKTTTQLLSATIVIFPYVLIAENISTITKLEPIAIVMLVLVGILHTGVAYVLYFGSMSGVKAQTVALFSYIDPIVAIILSAVILKEGMGVVEIIGAVLVLGATIISEIEFKKSPVQ